MTASPDAPEFTPSRDAHAFADYLRDQAGRRRSLAQDFPDDARNERCARALEALAEIVLNEPSLAGPVGALAVAGGDCGEFHLWPETDRQVGRYGFYGEQDPVEFVGYLIELEVDGLLDMLDDLRPKTEDYESKREDVVVAHDVLAKHGYSDLARRIEQWRWSPS